MDVQVFVWLNSLALPPVTFTPDTTRTPLPVLLKVTSTGGLLVPAVCEGKVTEAGENFVAGAGPVVLMRTPTPATGVQRNTMSGRPSPFMSATRIGGGT
jgi:hypothetical protein